MDKPRIAVFSGPRSTIANSPTLVTGNKGRLPMNARCLGATTTWCLSSFTSRL